VINRREFSHVLAAAAGAVTLAGCASTSTPGSTTAPATASAAPVGTAHTSFPAVKQVNAGVLNIGYAEAGPPNGPPVILLHGWPYDIYSYVDVAPLLAAKGYRVLVPYLRGYGSTQFLSPATFRNAQQAVVAVDIKAFMDALNIPKAIIGGFDWGARTADIMAVLWPDRVKALVSVSGYLITNLKAQLQPLPPAGEYGWWYQFYFATDRGVLGYRQNTHDFNKLIWKTVSPKWNFDDATFDRTAQAFSNPDHVSIVIHNYRWRQSLAPGDPQYDGLEQQLQLNPVIGVPTITIASDFDGAAADGTAYRKQFTGKYDHRIFDGIGHDVPQEAPQLFANAIVDVDAF
jgi:pimeloyl-ACP methyl ester carboxylesterase